MLKIYNVIPPLMILSACGASSEPGPSDPEKAKTAATCAETSAGDLEISLPFAMRCFNERHYDKAALIWRELEQSEGEANWGLGELYRMGEIGTDAPSIVNGEQITDDEARFINFGAKSKDGRLVDKREAIKYYEKAISLGFRKAAEDLGSIYYWSEWTDTKSNYGCLKTAEPVYRINGATGEMDPIVTLSDASCHQLGLERRKREWGDRLDYKKAIKYFEISAGEGSPFALRVLGDIYNFGDGVPQDLRKALNYYRDSAKNGGVDAIWNLSRQYAKEIPEKDLVKSYALGKVALTVRAVDGISDVNKIVELDMSSLRIDEIKEAEKIIKLCLVDYDADRPDIGNYKVDFENCEF